jgi:hypothetical protein
LETPRLRRTESAEGTDFAVNSLERGGAQRKRGGALRKATDHKNTARAPGTMTSISNWTPRKTFAFLRAASAFSAIKMF